MCLFHFKKCVYEIWYLFFCSFLGKHKKSREIASKTKETRKLTLLLCHCAVTTLSKTMEIPGCRITTFKRKHAISRASASLCLKYTYKRLLCFTKMSLSYSMPFGCCAHKIHLLKELTNYSCFFRKIYASQIYFFSKLVVDQFFNNRCFY